MGVLTGPNLAREIAAGQPAATVVATTDPEPALAVQSLLMGPTLRVYTNPDVVGCEAAGALKNVMAIAAGMADGLGYGDNSTAALITRALAELTRLGVAMGGRPLTFAGLAGMGDLVATCISAQSRNRQVGVALGEGRRLEEITAEMHMVAEGSQDHPRGAGPGRPARDRHAHRRHGGPGARRGMQPRRHGGRAHGTGGEGQGRSCTASPDQRHSPAARR